MERNRVSATTSSKQDQKIDDLMERASAALADTDYFGCAQLATEALHAAARAESWERMARIVLPLQEARRQIRLAAIDTGKIHKLTGDERTEIPKVKPGCWYVEPPFVGADGRAIKEEAEARRAPVMVVVREPLTKSGACPIVMIGPETVRAYVEPPKKVTMDWMIAAAEALGDAAIEQVDMGLAPEAIVTKLLARLQTIPDHEKLHQALEAACLQAAESSSST